MLLILARNNAFSLYDVLMALVQYLLTDSKVVLTLVT
jgi:hypothetical protein